MRLIPNDFLIKFGIYFGSNLWRFSPHFDVRRQLDSPSTREKQTYGIEEFRKSRICTPSRQKPRSGHSKHPPTIIGNRNGGVSEDPRTLPSGLRPRPQWTLSIVPETVDDRKQELVLII